MELLEITPDRLKNASDDELLSLNHRLHQLFGTVGHISNAEHQDQIKNEIMEKFKYVTAEMEKRNFKVDETTPLYKAVFKKDSMPIEVANNFVKAVEEPILIIPNYVSLIGSSVNTNTPNDLDILIRDPIRKESLEVLLSKLVPESDRKYLHFVYDPTGPHKEYKNLYNLILQPAEDRNVQEIHKETLKPLVRFQPLKTSGGYGKEAFFSTEDAWKFWGAGYADVGITVEIKYDGFRTIAEYDGKDTLIYFEDSKDDRSKIFPVFVSDLKAIGEPVILDGELVLIKGETKVPRKDMMVLLGAKPDLTGYSYQYEVFDCLYFKGEDLHEKPWTERHEILKQICASFDFKAIKLVTSNIVHNESDFKAQSEACASVQDSEGAFYKVINSDYPLGGASPLWAKRKSIKELHGVVLAVTEVK